jgi:hypothetical protein
MLYSALAKGPYKVAGYIDPNDIRIVGIIYRPNVWQASTVYYLRGSDDYDIVMPTTANGYYYQVINPGKSGTVEPTWPTTVGLTVKDGGIVWQAVAYNLMPPSESISSSVFTASDGVTLTSSSMTSNTTQTTIATIPSTVTSFTITNVTDRSNGEQESVSLQFKVATR